LSGRKRPGFGFGPSRFEVASDLCDDFRMLIGEHDVGIADANLRVADAAVGSVEPHHLRGPETLLVEVEGGGAVVDDEVGCDGVVSIGNGLDRHDWFLARTGLG